MDGLTKDFSAWLSSFSSPPKSQVSSMQEHWPWKPLGHPLAAKQFGSLEHCSFDMIFVEGQSFYVFMHVCINISICMLCVCLCVSPFFLYELL